jgi:succinylglutamate desuccinylase
VRFIGDRERPRVTPGRREIGHAGGHTPGPLLVCIAAQHGNEPSGILALDRVFRQIEARCLSLRGELVGLAGNLSAVKAGERFLSKDLNRLWTSERIERIDAGAPGAETGEDREQRELLAAIRKFLRGAPSHGAIVFDLHSASAPTAPFLILGDTLRNREFARRFPVPVVLGLEEKLDGTLGEYATGLGHISLAFEAGQHADPRSVDMAESAIWLMLVLSEALPAADVPDLGAHRARLSRAGAGIPKILEILARHEIAPGDEFRMRPGFRNFDRIRKGEILATDRHGEVRSPGHLRIFLPLYQNLGSEGFFLARPVNPVWLTVSSILRRVGLPKIAHLLPGVSKHPVLRNTLVVDPAIARFFFRELFHLLGYRLESPDGAKVLASRRPE